jgi:hypothetical protein
VLNKEKINNYKSLLLYVQYMREQAQWVGEPVVRMTAGTAAAEPAGHIYLIGRTSSIHVFFKGIVPRDELFLWKLYIC